MGISTSLVPLPPPKRPPPKIFQENSVFMKLTEKQAEKLENFSDDDRSLPFRMRVNEARSAMRGEESFLVLEPQKYNKVRKLTKSSLMFESGAGYYEREFSRNGGQRVGYFYSLNTNSDNAVVGSGGGFDPWLVVSVNL